MAVGERNIGWYLVAGWLAAIPLTVIDVIVRTLSGYRVEPPTPSGVAISFFTMASAAVLFSAASSPLSRLVRAAGSRIGPAGLAIIGVASLWLVVAADMSVLVSAVVFDGITNPQMKNLLQVWVTVGFLLAGAAATIGTVAGVKMRNDIRVFVLAVVLLLANAVFLTVKLLDLVYYRMPGAVWFVELVLVPLVLWLLVVLLMHSGIADRWNRSVSGRPRGRAVVVACSLALPLFALLPMQFAADGVLWISVGHGLSNSVLGFARASTDFDHDGASALFCDGDCAGFDPRVGPRRRDVPDNRVDEDCDGRDSTSGAQPAFDGSRVFALPESSGRSLNVLVLCIDAMRADRVHFNGAQRSNTPSLDILAAESSLYSNTVATASATRESVPGILSGLYPSGIKWVREHRIFQIDPAQQTLPVWLGASGWYTMAVVDEWITKFLPSLNRGFDRYEPGSVTPLGANVRHLSGPVPTFKAIEFLSDWASGSSASKPFFLYVHFGAPHDPYDVHDDPGLPSFGDQPIDLYDAEIAWDDRYVGVLLSYLKARDLYDDTLIVVYGDHGEEFGEHGGQFHARTLNVESIAVPLVVKIPGRPAATHDDRVSLVDVAPTILDVLGLRPAGFRPQGYSLLNLDAAGIPDRPIYSEVMVNNEGDNRFRKAIYQGDFKLLWDMSTNETVLYNVASDPRETTPLQNATQTSSMLDTLKKFVAAGDYF